MIMLNFANNGINWTKDTKIHIKKQTNLNRIKNEYIKWIVKIVTNILETFYIF